MIVRHRCGRLLLGHRRRFPSLRLPIAVRIRHRFHTTTIRAAFRLVDHPLQLLHLPVVPPRLYHVGHFAAPETHRFVDAHLHEIRPHLRRATHQIEMVEQLRVIASGPPNVTEDDLARVDVVQACVFARILFVGFVNGGGSGGGDGGGVGILGIGIRWMRRRVPRMVIVVRLGVVVIAGPMLLLLLLAPSALLLLLLVVNRCGLLLLLFASIVAALLPDGGVCIGNAIVRIR